MIKNISSIILIFAISSCSFFNSKTVPVSINSSPAGAGIYIDNQYYGDTPRVIQLVPNKNYQANIVKKGYGSANLNLETWLSVRGGRGADTTRCVLDVLGTMLVVPAIAFYNNCNDFKQTAYSVSIVNSSSVKSDFSRRMFDQRVDQQNFNQRINQQNYGNDNQMYNGISPNDAR